MHFKSRHHNQLAALWRGFTSRDRIRAHQERLGDNEFGVPGAAASTHSSKLPTFRLPKHTMKLPLNPPSGPVTLTQNARTVLEKRYLVKNEKGLPVEQPEDL